MRYDERFHGSHEEYPRFHSECGIVQADWLEDDRRSASYILHKPDVVLSINGIEPDKNGDLDITANDLYKIDVIPNQTLYTACNEIFHDVFHKESVI